MAGAFDAAGHLLYVLILDRHALPLADLGKYILGALVAIVLAKRWGSQRVRRWLLIAATAACAVLLLRGMLGLTLLGVELLEGTFDEQTPAALLAIEPCLWWVDSPTAAWPCTSARRPPTNNPSH